MGGVTAPPLLISKQQKQKQQTLSLKFTGQNCCIKIKEKYLRGK
jgi:hypothetical protein